jgi:cell division cycle 2-like
MASKGSKWTSATNEDDAAASAQRKAEKAERKRRKETRAHRIAETVDEPNEPPAKRQRTTTAERDTPAEGAHILSFPTIPIGHAKSVSQFDLLNAIEEGSYGLVSRARRKSTGTLVALKKLKIDTNTTEGFPVTGLREIQTLKASRHANIVELQEVVMGETLKE